MPKRLSRRVEIILIKMKHLLKEAEHLISPKGKAGWGGGQEGQREGNTQLLPERAGANEQAKGTRLAAVGCCRAGVQRASPLGC